MIKINDYAILSSKMSTLKKTSLDKTNNTYMTECLYPVVNFDKVTTAYLKNKNIDGVPCSNDALLVTEDGKTFFIEFKNGHIDDNDIVNIKEKIYASIPILTDIIKKYISDTRKALGYILVFNEEKNSKIAIKRHLAKKTKVENIDFNLKLFKNFFFKDVHTYTKKEFDDFLIRNNIR